MEQDLRTCATAREISVLRKMCNILKVSAYVHLAQWVGLWTSRPRLDRLRR